MNQIEILNHLCLNNGITIAGRTFPVLGVGMFDKEPALLLDNRHLNDPIPPKMEYDVIGKVYAFGFTIFEGDDIRQVVAKFNMNHVYQITDVMLVADMSPTMAEVARQLRRASEAQKATIASQEQMLKDQRTMISSVEEAIAKEKAFHAELDAFLASLDK